MTLTQQIFFWIGALTVTVLSVIGLLVCISSYVIASGKEEDRKP